MGKASRSKRRSTVVVARPIRQRPPVVDDDLQDDEDFDYPEESERPRKADMDSESYIYGQLVNIGERRRKLLLEEKRMVEVALKNGLSLRKISLALGMSSAALQMRAYRKTRNLGSRG